MSRIHLFEFEDQSWFPSFLRDYGTEFLQFLSNKTKMYAPIVPNIQSLLKRQQISAIVDIGSGGGGGWKWLGNELKKQHPQLKITLTDFFPNIEKFKEITSNSDLFLYCREPVDARQVHDNLKGLRTMFLSFHHFKPNDAKQILQNAIDSGNPIAIYEAQERSLPSLLAMIFSPITLWLTTPFIRPFKLGRIIFTYLFPIVPVFVMWDGIVSSLRTYSVKEMKSLVDSLSNSETYNWNIGRMKSGPGVILYLEGSSKLTESIS
jgi:hypothetical protein